MTNDTESLGVYMELPAMTMVQPTSADGYMIVARDLLPAIEVLSAQPAMPPRGCAMLAGQAMECALKAFLCHKGKEKEVRKRENQHNLTNLWQLAYQEHDLNIPAVPPDWVTILSSGHGPDFYLRYQEGAKKNIVHGGATPALIPMANGLREFIANVERVIKG